VNGPNLDSDMPTELLEVTAGKRLPLSIPQLQTRRSLKRDTVWAGLTKTSQKFRKYPNITLDTVH
jgi:hypothetical protein